MDVVMISPGFPAEMPLFTRGLAEVGARVIGVGDQPEQALPAEVRECLSGYLRVQDLWDEAAVTEEVRRFLRGRNVDLVECLWEPGMLLAARLREDLGLEGLTVEETRPFRDKEVMKQKLDACGLRTPRHARASSTGEVREAAGRIGFPLIVKPISGAGSADTHEVRDESELERVLELVRHVEEVSVEEFIEGDEFTFDTVCAGGRPLFENVAWYRPKPLFARQNAWVSSQAISLRDLDMDEIAPGRALGHAVLTALGFRSGFTHMEWFRTPTGEAVFGEIGARPPGARLVHVMNYSADCDLFVGWAEAVCHGRLSQDVTKKYNAAVTFKRARGEGVVQRYEGLERLLASFGEHVVNIELTPIGAPARDWRKSVVGDGWVVVRHPDLKTTIEMADRVATDLRILAG